MTSIQDKQFEKYILCMVMFNHPDGTMLSIFVLPDCVELIVLICLFFLLSKQV